MTVSNCQMQYCKTKRRVSRAGFTLIEVLLVLVILVVLGAIAVPMYTGIQSNAEIRAAKTQVTMLEQAIDNFRLEAKKYPSDLKDLVVRPSDLAAEHWAGPYVKENKELEDPWNHPINYANPGKHNSSSYDVWSLGPDGQDGSEDDVGNFGK